MTAKRNPFIEGFREPTLSKNSFLVLADVRGDGEGKLVIWSEQQSQLIVYKGSNRQLEKPIKLKNVSGIIHYQDEQRNAQSVIALTAENALYIFRGLAESFRLRIPDNFAQVDEQIIWSQYYSDPDELGVQLQKLESSALSETAKYYLGSNSIQRKSEIIKKVLTEGVNQKDSISAITLLKQSEVNNIGNLVLGTEFNRLYILDEFGHSIISKRIVPFTPSIILARGNVSDTYMIVLIGREGDICLYTNKDKNEPIQRLRNNVRIVSACMSYPDIILVGADQTVSHHLLSNSTFKFATKKYSIKLNQQPIKVEFLKFKGQKLTIIAFENQVRFYNEKDLNYVFMTDFKLYNVIWGSFAREECCLILLYEQAGFQVLILHRQFNIKEKYGSNKSIKSEYENIPIPKKSNHFLTYWNNQDEDESLIYKHFQRGLKLLKWRTLRQKYEQNTIKPNNKIQINSKVLGLGPIFNIQIQIQNVSQEVLFNIGLVFNVQSSKVQFLKKQSRILMLAPLCPVQLQVSVRSLSCKNEKIELQVINGNNMVGSVIYIPNCEQFSQGVIQ